MNVDLPVPGAPLIPTRVAPPVAGINCSRSATASARWSARVDSTSVIARASERRSPARTASTRASGCGSRLTHEREDVRRGLRDVAAGPEHRRHSGRREEFIVGLRDDAADYDDDVTCAFGAKRVNELRHESSVARGLARHTDHVHIVLDRLARRLLRSLEEGTDLDVEAEVGERRRDHLGTAVVAVLTELRHEDARPPTLGPCELFDLGADLLKVLVALVGAAVHA